LEGPRGLQVGPTSEAGGGWVSSSWVGIDGYSQDDVLQAGVDQQVDSNGSASYTAWFEWFAPKVDGSPDYVDSVNIPNFW
jgi:hypothetical protein